jgi:hypothetical protein
MLVDLARNDIGRVAQFGSVRVTEFMGIERYSHVMHIVSNVTGRLRSGCTQFDLIKETFPAGTVSGAPKIRAMQIISELEKTRRGCYAGAIGYFGFDGNIDSCIELRCAVLKNGKAYFQAGAGIVADSEPEAEYRRASTKPARWQSAVNGQANAIGMKLGIAHRQNGEPAATGATADPNLGGATPRLTNGENLTRAEAAKFLEWLISPNATDPQIADALIALTAKARLSRNSQEWLKQCGTARFDCIRTTAISSTPRALARVVRKYSTSQRPRHS